MQNAKFSFRYPVLASDKKKEASDKNSCRNNPDHADTVPMIGWPDEPTNTVAMIGLDAPDEEQENTVAMIGGDASHDAWFHPTILYVNDLASEEGILDVNVLASDEEDVPEDFWTRDFEEDIFGERHLTASKDEAADAAAAAVTQVFGKEEAEQEGVGADDNFGSAELEEDTMRALVVSDDPRSSEPHSKEDSFGPQYRRVVSDIMDSTRW